MTTKKFQTLGLMVKRDDADASAALRLSLAHLKDHPVELLLEENAAGIADDASLKALPLDALARQCDLMIVIGGDGTLLTAARAMAESDVPIVGVNLGRLGFLADVSLDQLGHFLDQLLNGQLITERRALLTTWLERDGNKVNQTFALNDAVLHKWEMARMIEFDAYIDDSYITTYRSDGLVIATPTGSTAYSLSAGGPILHPALDAIGLSPICPHTLNNRPLVIGAESEIRIRIREGFHKHSLLSIDGQVCHRIEPGDDIVVARHSKRIQLLHPPGYDYYEILRAKLRWGEQPWI
ncbi:MAG: NAD(+) kinase [Gammaproteobacteria bacterium]|nr:MAG: NAD(+) kinase [Gammaproteobacteria bacterium]